MRMAAGKESEGALIGNKAISRYLGISIDTVVRWRKVESLPACVLPDGRIFVTKSLIDKWVLARMEVLGAVNGVMGRPRKVKTDKQGLTGDSSSRRPTEPPGTA